MHQSKLVKAISELSAWELRHFHDYVHSPFFNKHEKLTLLFDILVDAAPDFEAEALDRYQLYDRIFANGGYKEQKFKDLLSLGMKAFRNFLSFYHLRQDEFSTGMALLEELRERSWDAEYVKMRKSMYKALEKGEEKLQERQMKRLQLHESWISFLTSRRNRFVDDSVQVASDQLDTYFIVAKLKYGVEMANRQNVVAQDFDRGLLEYVLKYCDDRPELLDKQPEIGIYYQVYRCLTLEEPEEAFADLLLRLGSHSDQFPKPELREMYGYAINFCIKQINRGQSQYLNLLLELYQRALDSEAMYIDGWLSQWDYKNIVSASLKAGRFDWCAGFIEAYKEKVEPGSRENAHTYNLASLFFEQGEYGQTLRLLQHVEFSDVFYHLGSKVLLLKSFFELNDYDALSSLCDSFKIYLKRNKTLSKYHYTVNWNLISFTRKLADIRRKAAFTPQVASQEKLVQLQEAIAAKGSVAQLAWLRKKVDAVAVQLI